MTSLLRTVTFNCRGWNNGSSFVAGLLPTCDILLIQEHWLFHENLNALNINDQFMYTAVSGMDSTRFQSGRPFGSCGILFQKSLINSITPINTNAKRFCAVSLSGLNNNSS